MVKDPVHPTVGIGAEALMDRHPRLQIGGILVLIVFQIFLITKSRHNL
jgi:hypothetical protein